MIIKDKNKKENRKHRIRNRKNVSCYVDKDLSNPPLGLWHTDQGENKPPWISPVLLPGNNFSSLSAPANTSSATTQILLSDPARLICLY